jgi:ABC-type branched-subunit amino acid transport system substrate-binding protein
MSTYLAVDLIARGLEAAGKKDQAAVVGWVRGNTHDTIMGKVSFNPDGEIIGFPWVMNAVKDGKFVPVAIWNASTKSFDKL